MPSKVSVFNPRIADNGWSCRSQGGIRRRIARLRSSLVEPGLDAYLVYGNLEQMGNVTWIANYDPFKGNAFVLVPGDGPLALVTDSVFHNEPMHS